MHEVYVRGEHTCEGGGEKDRRHESDLLRARVDELGGDLGIEEAVGEGLGQDENFRAIHFYYIMLSRISRRVGVSLRFFSKYT